MPRRHEPGAVEHDAPVDLGGQLLAGQVSLVDTVA
jgi:hypothetical protein